MPDEPVPDDAAGLRAANVRLRAVVAAKDEQVACPVDYTANTELIRTLGDLDESLS